MKQTVEKRRKSYKKSINTEENRKHRSSVSKGLRRVEKEKVITRHRTEVNSRSIDPENNQGSKRVKYTGSAREKLIQFYNDHNKSKLDSVDATLEKYASREEELFKNLAKRYSVDPAVFGAGESSTSTAFMSTAGGAFASYAGSTPRVTFGSLATPKAKAQSNGYGFGSHKQTPSDNRIGKMRTTITSLKTYADELRGPSDSDSDDNMECD